MEKIIMPRGGINQVSTLMNCDRKTVRAALCRGESKSDLHLRIRKCALDHGGIEIKKNIELSYDWECEDFTLQYVNFRFIDGGKMIVNCKDKVLSIVAADGEIVDYDISDIEGITDTDITTLLSMVESIEKSAYKVFVAINTFEAFER